MPFGIPGAISSGIAAATNAVANLVKPKETSSAGAPSAPAEPKSSASPSQALPSPKGGAAALRLRNAFTQTLEKNKAAKDASGSSSGELHELKAAVDELGKKLASLDPGGGENSVHSLKSDIDKLAGQLSRLDGGGPPKGPDNPSDMVKALNKGAGEVEQIKLQELQNALSSMRETLATNQMRRAKESLQALGQL